jgi:hypothetical protein
VKAEIDVALPFTLVKLNIEQETWNSDFGVGVLKAIMAMQRINSQQHARNEIEPRALKNGKVSGLNMTTLESTLKHRLFQE